MYEVAQVPAGKKELMLCAHELVDANTQWSQKEVEGFLRPHHQLRLVHEHSLASCTLSGTLVALLNAGL